jgi:ketosteroid isomerase-like protein
MKWFAAAALVVFVVPACRPNNAAGSASDSTAVADASEQYRQAWLQGDTATALGKVSNDVRIMINGVPDIVGMDGATELFVREMSTYKIPTLTINRQNLIVRGDYAIDVGTFEETMVPKTGAPIQGAGRYMTIWRREGNEWKIFRFMINSASATTT